MLCSFFCIHGFNSWPIINVNQNQKQTNCEIGNGHLQWMMHVPSQQQTFTNSMATSKIKRQNEESKKKMNKRGKLNQFILISDIVSRKWKYSFVCIWISMMRKMRPTSILILIQHIYQHSLELNAREIGRLRTSGSANICLCFFHSRSFLLSVCVGRCCYWRFFVS